MEPKAEFDFGKWQMKRDAALLLLGCGVSSLVGSVFVLLTALKVHEGAMGWVSRNGVASLTIGVLAVACGRILQLKARSEYLTRS